MTPRNRRQWQNSHKIFNMPIPGYPSIRRQRQEHHASNPRQSKEHAKFESLSDFRDLDEEVRGFYFFGGGAPSHVVAEHVGKDGGGDVEGEAAEEDGEKQGPFEIEEDCECLVVAVKRPEMTSKKRERTISEKPFTLHRPTLLVEMIFVPISHSRQSKIS